MLVWHEEQTEQQVAVLDLHCILWTLQTSPDRSVRLSPLNCLATMILVNFDLTIVIYCFDTLISYIEITSRYPEVTRGTEQPGVASALVCLHSLSCLAVINPKPRVLKDIRWLYTRAVRLRTESNRLPPWVQATPYSIPILHETVQQ